MTSPDTVVAAASPQIPDQKIYDEIMASASEYLGQPGVSHPRYATYQYPQRYYVLSDLLKSHVLRESGDIKKFIRLAQEMHSHEGKQVSTTDAALLEMAEWLDQKLEALPPMQEASEEKLMISMLVWGDKFIEKMLRLTFKSMMAPGNLPALTSEKKVLFFVQTNAAGQAAIEASSIVAKMRNLGVEFEYAILPDSMLEKNNPDTLYWFVGMGATIGLAYARRIGAAFHHSYPDVIYNDEFFSEALRLSKKHQVILGPGHSIDEQAFKPLLPPYESDDAIAIPCADLAALLMNALHMSCLPFVVNSRPMAYHFPRSHSLIWEGTHALFFNCPHMNFFWLSADTIRKLPDDRYYISLDSEADLIIEGNNFHVPQAEDKMLMEQVVEQSRYAANDSWNNATDFGHFFWGLISHRDLFKVFARGQVVLINRNIRPVPMNAMRHDRTADQIGAEKSFLFNSCLSVDPLRGQRFARGRSHTGQIYRQA